MRVLVRRAVADDARAIAEIQVAGWRAAYLGLVPDAFLDAFTVQARAARWTELLEQGSETYVAKSGFCAEAVDPGTGVLEIRMRRTARE